MLFLVSRMASQTFAPSSAAVRAATDPTWPVGPKIMTEAMIVKFNVVNVQVTFVLCCAFPNTAQHAVLHKARASFPALHKQFSPAECRGLGNKDGSLSASKREHQT
jgi:hypothetical protein